MRYDLALKGWGSIGFAATMAAQRAEGSVAMVDHAINEVTPDGSASSSEALSAARSALESELAVLRMVELWCAAMVDGAQSVTESAPRSLTGDGSAQFHAA